jgi:hypothetical protein
MRVIMRPFIKRRLLRIAAIAVVCSMSLTVGAFSCVEPAASADSSTSDVQSDVAPGMLPEGASCEAAVECDPGLICALGAPTDEAFSCVDPSIGVYDDGSDPDLGLMRAGAGWARKRIDGWEENDLRCNDGSPYAYYISPGNDPDRWLIFFKGGGLCASEESCGVRWALQPQFMRQYRSSQENPTYTPGRRNTEGAGIYSTTGRLNDGGDLLIPNAFADYTVVHLHYCSSDLFGGTSLPDENSARLFFRGRSITEALLGELLAGVDLDPIGWELPPMSQATEVIIAGGSAGAIGARFNMDAMANRIHGANPDTSVLAISDSVLIPGVRPHNYPSEASNDLWAPVMDLDCVEAHGEDSALCSDSLHLLTGEGTATYFDAVDSGHLGVPGSTEAFAVERHMAFMATGDGTAMLGGRVFPFCARAECTTDSDCGAGSGCLTGVCFDVEPCRAELCDPDDGACYGLDDAPSCLGEVASHRNVCNDDAECPDGVGCCEEGETCLSGYCLEDIYLGCQDDEVCPEGYQCTGATCSAGVASAAECDLPGYEFTNDTGTCDQLIGCNAALACGDGYTCLSRELTPNGQTFELALVEALEDTAPELGIYLANSNTHTAVSGAKYYGINMPNVRGDTFAEAVNEWYVEGVDYVDHIMKLPDIPLPLWAWKVSDVTAQGMSTSSTGCEDAAIAFLFCEVDSSCESPADALATLAIGDEGSSFAGGDAATDGARLKLVLRANPECTASPLTVAEEAELVIDLQYSASAEDTRSIRLRLPAGTLTELPPPLFLGAAGTVYADAALSSILVPRLE